MHYILSQISVYYIKCRLGWFFIIIILTCKGEKLKISSPVFCFSTYSTVFLPSSPLVIESGGREFSRKGDFSVRALSHSCPTGEISGWCLCLLSDCKYLPYHMGSWLFKCLQDAGIWLHIVWACLPVRRKEISEAEIHVCISKSWQKYLACMLWILLLVKVPQEHCAIRECFLLRI